ncbi:MetQ/NlpA family ABC transporter substrate-binding protein [Geomonas ferrireducens]|uniref:MetQ/NlpA family ABC transporter substrate-binding protein n=1 Tax=Geomonas ferrireducens TaxID=2570227 RepID=UPI0018E09F59|nr:MetQ/NlpA family ABC transporter substrate-binding protein [Geomonas ferrireducens]
MMSRFNGRLSLALVALALVVVAAAGCKKKEGEAGKGAEGAASTAGKTLKVGAAVVPHADILKFVVPKLKEQGVNLEVVTFDDEVQLNPALAEKQIDANYFQHVPYLEAVVKEKKYQFQVAGSIHVEPIGLYSNKIKSIAELKTGAQIAVPNNPSNEYRALALLEKQGLIKLKPGISNFQATPKDIVENPKKIKFVEVEAAQLTRTLPDVDGAVINTNFILDAKIDPQSAVVREDAKSPYANIIVVRKGEEAREDIKKLVAALQSPELKQFLKEKYGAAIIPAF